MAYPVWVLLVLMSVMGGSATAHETHQNQEDPNGVCHAPSCIASQMEGSDRPPTFWRRCDRGCWPYFDALNVAIQQVFPNLGWLQRPMPWEP